MGKLFLKGIPGIIEKSVEKAFYFFHMGAFYKDNYFFINSFYSQKCLNYLNENKEFLNHCSFKNYDLNVLNNIQLPKLNLDQYIKDERVCVVCCSNFRQIIFANCGHKSICLLCFEKMKKGNEIAIIQGALKCPMCQQNSGFYVNSFEDDMKLNI